MTTLFHDKETGRYLATLDDRYIGYVQKVRERTPVMEGRILVGHTERTVWITEDAAGHKATHRTRSDGVLHLVRKGMKR